MIKLKEILLNETIQLADKLYFKNGKLNNNDRELLLSITNGDNYSKFIADIIYYYKDRLYEDELIDELNKYYNIIKSYNKNNNLIYTNDFENVDINKIENIKYFLSFLDIRNEILMDFKKLPSIAKRNLKNDLSREFESGELYRYKERLLKLSSQLSLLDNKPDRIKNKILKKAFKSGNSLYDVIYFFDEKKNLLGRNENITEKELIEISKEHSDIGLVYNQNNILVFEVTSPQGIKDIGCNSLWCFTYNKYSSNILGSHSVNGIVYVIFNLNLDVDDEKFMTVVIKEFDWNNPDDDEFYDDEHESPIYNQVNDPISSPYGYLKDTFGNLKIPEKLFTFE